MPDESKISLDMTLRAILLVALRGLTTDSQVELLLRAGFPNVHIADLTGSSANAIAQRKVRMKKKGAK
jgi:predicted RNA polymerase sigma factor